MSKARNIHAFIKELEIRFEQEMPRIRREIQVYEKKLAEGKLIQNPTVSPQFNGR